MECPVIEMGRSRLEACKIRGLILDALNLTHLRDIHVDM